MLPKYGEIIIPTKDLTAICCTFNCQTDDQVTFLAKKKKGVSKNNFFECLQEENHKDNATLTSCTEYICNMLEIETQDGKYEEDLQNKHISALVQLFDQPREMQWYHQQCYDINLPEDNTSYLYKAQQTVIISDDDCSDVTVLIQVHELTYGMKINYKKIIKNTIKICYTEISSKVKVQLYKYLVDDNIKLFVQEKILFNRCTTLLATLKPKVPYLIELIESSAGYHVSVFSRSNKIFVEPFFGKSEVWKHCLPSWHCIEKNGEYPMSIAGNPCVLFNIRLKVCENDSQDKIGPFFFFLSQMQIKF
ncbi:hypothetical protein RFI_30720 [Reticulomyxa filosa]|uniref:Uncharacterized protein n=1 Tax=Reticulomyxa filosa TaxID=46433 RepID=X6M119_RETFI|nr:hypothetical protein RFI_30720 [Reticulomyxa filosa]|eukprot:ETO06675.1 hypothetical protein RFI_30720 [Reticulomyxa filosa]